MTKSELLEAVSVTGIVLNGLLHALQGITGMDGAQAKYLIGALAANGREELAAGGNQFWVDLGACFEAAQKAGANYLLMDQVRASAEALLPTGTAGIAVKNFAVRMSLVELARILAATTFKSRDEIDTYFDQINAAFERAEVIAADNMDNVAYRLLINLHAAVSNDLANRSRPLARMITYSFPSSLPSLALAQRLYADPTRADELIGENKPIHPLFMSPTGKALSS